MPFVLLHMHMPRRSETQLKLTVLGLLAVNAVTIYVFLYRPFTWGDGTEARFMW